MKKQDDASESMDIGPDRRPQDLSRTSKFVKEGTADGGIEFSCDEKEDPAVQPTEEDVESVRKKLVESLKAENQMVERQQRLYEEQRDLKIAIERAEADTKLSELQKTRERLRSQLEEVDLKNL